MPTTKTGADHTEVYDELAALDFEFMPLKRGSKEPAETGWRTNDYSNFDAEAWRRKGGNVGIRLKHDQLVVDVDPRNGGKLIDLELDLNILRHRTLSVRTGGGGDHIFFRKLKGQRVANHVDGYPGVDIKTGGGFVVAPGSLHPDTGNLYEVSGDIPDMVPAMPRELSAKVRKRVIERPVVNIEITPEQLAELLAGLDPRKFGKGHHDDFVGIMAASHQVTGAEGRAVFLDWAALDPNYGPEASELNGERWDSFEVGKPGGAGIGTICKHLIDAGRGDLVASLSRTPASEDFEDDPDTIGVDSKKDSLEATYAESLAWVEPKFLVDGWVPFGGFAQCFGKQKTMKTFIMLDLALCVATGMDFYGHTVTRGRTTYVAAEGSRARFRDRITAWCRLNRADPAELAGWFYFVNRPINLTEPKSVIQFVESLREGPQRSLIVFDTVAKNSGGMDEDTKGMKAFTAGANEVRLRTGAACLVIHHEGKNAALGSRGSTVLPGDVDLSMRAVRVSHNKVKLTVHEARDVESGESMIFEARRVVIGDELEDAIALELVARRRKAEPKNARERIIIMIAEAGIIKSSEDLVDDGVPGMRRANVFEQVKNLRAQGLVHQGDELELTAAGVEVAMTLGAAIPSDELDGDGDE